MMVIVGLRTLGGKLALTTSATEADPDTLDAVMLIFGNYSDANSMLVSLGILMLTYSPGADQAKLGAPIGADVTQMNASCEC